MGQPAYLLSVQHRLPDVLVQVDDQRLARKYQPGQLVVRHAHNLRGNLAQAILHFLRPHELRFEHFKLWQVDCGQQIFAILDQHLHLLD